jgi:periplasmic divalent cation tolerance protein
MPEASPNARIVLTTTASVEDAERLGRALVEERLAACVSLVPGVRSTYRWEGRVEESTETMLVIKTALKQLAALEIRLHELHSYETPEFVVLEPESMSHGYLEWLEGCLRQP